jgi:hypothetical protein
MSNWNVNRWERPLNTLSGGGGVREVLHRLGEPVQARARQWERVGHLRLGPGGGEGLGV